MSSCPGGAPMLDLSPREVLLLLHVAVCLAGVIALGIAYAPRRLH